MIKFFLFFSNDSLIIPILILGIIWLNKEIFYHAICLLLLSMIYSHALKVSFQISSPLYGFVFPSGHMLASTVFYGWIAYQYKNIILSILTAALLIGVAISLVHANYHEYFHVVGGFFFAILLMIAYQYILLKKPLWINRFSIIVATILMLYIYLKIGAISASSWLGYYALIGFIFSSAVFQEKALLKKSNMIKIFISILSFLAIFSIGYIFKFIDAPVYLFQLKWLFIGISIPCISVIQK